MEQELELVFFGEVLPGVDPVQAKLKLLALLRVPVEQGERLFSGDRVVLKRRLGVAEGAKYLRHLRGLGIKAVLEVSRESPAAAPMAAVPTRPSGLSLVDEGASVPAATAPVAGGAVSAMPVPGAKRGAADTARPRVQEDVICPKCGERQPARTLCQACGVDMPRLRAAQASAKEEAPVARVFEDAKSSTLTYQGIPAPFMAGWGFEGRLSRGHYGVMWGFIGALTSLGIALSLHTETWLWLLPVAPVVVYQALRITMLRCHDCGWSGKWAFVAVIPLIGSLFQLVLGFLPGRDDLNRYGLPDTMPGMPLRLVVGAVVFGAAQLASSGWDAANQRELIAARAKASTDSPGAASALRAVFDPLDSLVMYSIADCTQCDLRRDKLAALGITHREIRIDDDAFDHEAFAERALEAGDDFDPYDLPYFEANGRLLSNPTLDQLAEALKY